MRITSSPWIAVAIFPLLTCDGVHVTVRDGKKLAMLFSSVVLQCQYDTRSTQTPVVQWLYKSYCADRTRDSFTLSETSGDQGPQLGASNHLDCSDNSRTVRIMASKQGASLTLSEHYKGRDITIINKADLRIGELQWGDSGVYFCKVVSGDDLEGKNEGQVELLVLGKTGVLDDVLPEFELDMMPEWLFVGCVVSGAALLLLLLSVCWCQCCPHSCCCYLRCCCCPDTCCCPKHLYEAGKTVKSSHQAHVALYPPCYGLPMVTQAAPSQIEPKMTVAPPVANSTAGEHGGDHPQSSQGQDTLKGVYFIEKDLEPFRRAKWDGGASVSMSELSSLHDADADFRQNYRHVQKKTLPPISDLNNKPQRHLASKANRLPPTHYESNGPEEQDRRWNCRSEYLPRKAFDSRGRSNSLDELEEFARNYGPRAGRRGHFYDSCEPERDFSMEPWSTTRHSPRRFHDDDDNWPRRSPPPSPRRRCNTNGSERYSASHKSYEDTHMKPVLERKARGREEQGGRVDEDSDTPSKSSKKGSHCYYSRSPTNRLGEGDSLPPYCEVERFRNMEPAERQRVQTMEPAARPFSYTHPNQSMSQTLQERREDKARKLTTHLSRDSLIV